jgi:DNA invertase Pin-like site-specific DNA recombinase
LSIAVTTLFNKGVKFISLTDNIDLSSASGTPQFNIISAFAQFERDIISERTKEGLKGLIRRTYI